MKESASDCTPPITDNPAPIVIKWRRVNPNDTRAHRLIIAVPGANRYKRGNYVCACGESFTYINKFHAHSAANN